MPVRIIYEFANDKLISAFYIFSQTDKYNDLYYDDFNTIIDIYTKAYGQPYAQNNNTAIWLTNTTQIEIVIAENNGSTSLGVLYYPADGMAQSIPAPGKIDEDIFANENGPENIKSTDFRNATWGMSMEEVYLSERIECYNVSDENEQALFGSDTVLNMPVGVYYKFIDNKLYNAGYIFTQTYIDNDLYYRDYYTIVDAYTKKHGQPSYQKDFASFWMTDTTDIYVILTEGETSISLGAMYYVADKAARSLSTPAKPDEGIFTNENSEEKHSRTDFRNATWGMSVEKVHASENIILHDVFADGQTLHGFSTFLSRRIGIFYDFVDNKLNRAGYVFLQAYVKDDLFNEDYYSVLNAYTKKYGQPYSQKDFNVNWVTDTTSISVDFSETNDGAMALTVYYYPLAENTPSAA